MSIAIATICRDGLVLCADRQVGTPDFKYYECKIFKVNLGPSRGTLVLGYAGLPSTMRVIVENLKSKLDYQNKGSEEVRRELQDVLNLALSGKPKDSHQLLCGFCDSGTFHLLKTYNREISPVAVWDCVGFGDSALTRYLGAIFLGSEIHLPVFRGVPICNYIVAQAKKYVQDCGGTTDLVVLTQQGEVFDQFSTPILDGACEYAELMFSAILTTATDPSFSAQTYEHLTKHLRETLDTTDRTFKDFLEKSANH